MIVLHMKNADLGKIAPGGVKLQEQGIYARLTNSSRGLHLPRDKICYAPSSKKLLDTVWVGKVGMLVPAELGSRSSGTTEHALYVFAGGF